jgi:hypothetical protein
MIQETEHYLRDHHDKSRQFNDDQHVAEHSKPNTPPQTERGLSATRVSDTG